MKSNQGFVARLRLLQAAVLGMGLSIAGHTATLPVSGGGAALQTAINSAVTGDVVQITDSLDYSPVVVAGKAITIEAAAGQNPRVVGDGSAQRPVWFDHNWQGCVWRGIDIIQNVPNLNFRGALQASWGGWLTTADYLTIEDCTISTNAPGVNLDGPVVGIEAPARLRNVTITRTDTNNNPVLRLSDYAGTSTIEDCVIGNGTQAGAALRNATLALEFPGQSPAVQPTFYVSGTTIYPNNTSNALQNLDSPRTWEIDDCSVIPTDFATTTSAQLLINSNAGAGGSEINFRRSRIRLNSRPAIDLTGHTGSTVTFTNCSLRGDRATGLFIVGPQSHQLEFRHCTFALDLAPSASTGALISLHGDNSASAASHFLVKNSVFDFPSRAYAVVQVPASITVQPVVESGVNMLRVGSFQATDVFHGLGTDLLNDPQLTADRLTPLLVSSVAGKGEDLGINDDINGGARPLPIATNPDLGAVESTESVPVELSGITLD